MEKADETYTLSLSLSLGDSEGFKAVWNESLAEVE